MISASPFMPNFVLAHLSDSAISNYSAIVQDLASTFILGTHQ